ncbi:MAG: hypothetical protein WAV28_08525 [Sedimentisphaerales bacterium]
MAIIRPDGYAEILSTKRKKNTLLSRGVDEPVCMIDVADSNAAYYYHFDGLGSVVALKGNILATFLLDRKVRKGYYSIASMAFHSTERRKVYNSLLLSLNGPCASW